ncbi:glutamyl-tRNA reductase [Ktedonosporobacter rubrisoli]|uniref:Glutamyl-tRNA reductase n=1 Tax=Ktedonosporobacter rubrisoli TaxID=2509675 RepID=A0A4P6JSM8_KTERU|nr:glutamyl-tRNA reductase [Ktedonosporobacter rubrisoli]QBD77876.1 glutamyl-tRNA reductase [Ktedonosporobacter rubrisoli]
MHIVVVGVDHINAPIALRERIACSTRQIPQVLGKVQQTVGECVLLSTCNRVELYAICSEIEQGRAALLHVLSEARQIAYDELASHCYYFADEQAVTHLFGVTCGLYSLVPGEPQIQGQVVEALEIAQGGGYAGPIMSALFRAAVVAGKRARSETAISRNATSISHVAVQLARHLFPNLHEASILLVGSGQMSELAARNLCDNGAQRLVIINRTQTNAVDLANTLNAQHRSFNELADALVEADVVISSTKAPRAVITAELVQAVMQKRAGRSLLLIDIALPRDVDAVVGDLPGVHLYNLDDLQMEVERGIHLRMQEVEHVQAIIAEESEAFERWLASLSVVGTISDLRQRADEVRQQELARTMKHLSATLTERDMLAVQELTTRLMNKLLHTPMLRLKAAAVAGQGHVYAEAMRYLFDLEEHDEANNHRNTGQQAGDEADVRGSRTITQAVARS